MSKGNYKVVAGGGLRNVHIFDDTGREITDRVRSFTVSQKVGEPNYLTLEVIGAEIDVTTFAENTREFVATGK